MTDEDRVRRALAYEIEPWTPDPDTLMRGGRRKALVRRSAAAGAALAVAATMTGVVFAVDRTGGGEPPVSGVLLERGPTTSPTAPSTAQPFTPYPCPVQTRWAVAPRQTPAPTTTPTLWLCKGTPLRMTDVPVKRCVRTSARQTPLPTAMRPMCLRVIVNGRPTTPVPTSVPAGE